MKVLVVDDDEGILRMMARLLAHRGHTVQTCKGPFGASAMALRYAPDLVLLDVMMPALDGVGLSMVLERTPLEPRPQIVLWSADDDTVERLRREGRLPILSKQSKPDEVVDELERLQAGKR